MTQPIPRVVAATPLGGYRLEIEFSDGRVGEWDFSKLAHETRPIVEPFKVPAFFSRVFIEMGALTWPNGYDCCPDSLYTEMSAAGALSVRN